jgi:hypothetical protein
MKNQISILTLSLALSLGAAHALAAQKVDGSYRLAVCSGACSLQDSASHIARGYLVLFTDSLPTSFTARTDRRRPAVLLLGRAAPNACFSISASQRYVDGREFYPGIIPRGETAWQTDDEGLHVRIYGSPDASYDLRGSIVGDKYEGVGIQRGCCGTGVHPFGKFVAIRIGPADSDYCSSSSG